MSVYMSYLVVSLHMKNKLKHKIHNEALNRASSVIHISSAATMTRSASSENNALQLSNRSGRKGSPKASPLCSHLSTPPSAPASPLRTALSSAPPLAAAPPPRTEGSLHAAGLRSPARPPTPPPPARDNGSGLRRFKISDDAAWLPSLTLLLAAGAEPLVRGPSGWRAPLLPRNESAGD